MRDDVPPFQQGDLIIVEAAPQHYDDARKVLRLVVECWWSEAHFDGNFIEPEGWMVKSLKFIPGSIEVLEYPARRYQLVATATEVEG